MNDQTIKLLTALKTLSDWMLSHTGPSDGTAEMLIAAQDIMAQTKRSFLMNCDNLIENLKSELEDEFTAAVEEQLIELTKDKVRDKMEEKAKEIAEELSDGYADQILERLADEYDA